MATFDADQAQLAQQQRRQQFAQMLLQQGMQQEPTQMVGPVAIRQSPLGALAKGLMAYQGAKGLSDSDTEISNIAQRRQTADNEAINKGMQLFNAGDKQGALAAFSASPRGQAYAAELMKSQLGEAPADQRIFQWLQTQPKEIQEAYKNYKQVGQKPETPYFTAQPTSAGVMIFNNRTGKYEMATDPGVGNALPPNGALPPGPGMPAPMPAPAPRLLPVAADPNVRGAVAQAEAVGTGTGQAQVAPVKARAEKLAEKQTEAEFSTPTALALMDDFEKAVKLQPNSAAGRGVQSALGYVGAGNEQQQNAIAAADTAASQLMTYANKLPGPASDKDRIDFKASIGAFSEPGATKGQKLAAIKQARTSFQRIVDKYGAGQGGAPGAAASAPAGRFKVEVLP